MNIDENLEKIISELDELGIHCKDNDGNWRTIEDVFQDLAKKWEYIGLQRGENNAKNS